MKNLVLVFTRNPELGKVKTRLALSIGNENTLAIYNYLLNHTKEVLVQTKADKRILYTEEVTKNDIWDASIFDKKTQIGNDLGERMKNAFADAFEDGYEKVVIIGTDLFNLEVSDVEMAFDALENNEVTIGPAEDGGYYLLGLKNILKNIFDNKNWSTETVFSDTLKDIQHLKYHLLATKNDIDTVDDIVNIEIFKKYL